MTIPQFDAFKAFDQARKMPVSEPAPESVPNIDGQVLQQIQDQRQQREEDVPLQLDQLDKADKFEQNAQVAQQAAEDSKVAAEGIRQEVSQLEQVNQEEEQEEAQALEGIENQSIAETFEANKPEIQANIAQTLGVDPKEFADGRVDQTFKNLEGILTGRMDENNAEQLALKAKLDSGDKLDKQEKLAIGMAAILPLIIGAIKGKPLQGLVAAAQSIGQLQKQRAESLKATEVKLDKAKQEGLKLIDLSSKISDRGVGALAKDEKKELDRELGEQKKDANTLKITGLSLTNVKKAEQAKQAIQATNSLLEKSMEKVQKSTKPVTKERALSARFAVQTLQAHEALRSGHVPTAGMTFLTSSAKSAQDQVFHQAAIQFVNATLRPESGAAISQGELDKAWIQYIPAFGDSPEVLKNKAEARAMVIAGNKAAAGDAYDRLKESMQGISTDAVVKKIIKGSTEDKRKRLKELEQEGF